MSENLKNKIRKIKTDASDYKEDSVRFSASSGKIGNYSGRGFPFSEITNIKQMKMALHLIKNSVDWTNPLKQSKLIREKDIKKAVELGQTKRAGLFMKYNEFLVKHPLFIKGIEIFPISYYVKEDEDIEKIMNMIQDCQVQILILKKHAKLKGLIDEDVNAYFQSLSYIFTELRNLFTHDDRRLNIGQNEKGVWKSLIANAENYLTKLSQLELEVFTDMKNDIATAWDQMPEDHKQNFIIDSFLPEFAVMLDDKVQIQVMQQILARNNIRIDPLNLVNQFKKLSENDRQDFINILVTSLQYNDKSFLEKLILKGHNSQ